MRRILSTATAVFIAASLLVGAAAHAGPTSVFNPGKEYTNLEFVPVGNARNAADSTSYGSVGYDFEMGKYEVTNAQYIEFLRAEASASDPHGLYNSDMGSSCNPYDEIARGGIARSGSENNYTYLLKTDMGDRPVNYVSWYDTLRFANWLTSGDTEEGIYGFTFDDDGKTIGATVTTTRTEALADYGVAYFLPTEDEWYKAAYHKNDGVTGTYWLYPTGSDDKPGRDLDDGSGNNANYKGRPYPIDSPHYLTEVGEFQDSASPYGTFDQGGNVWEWNEALIEYGDDQYRGKRGGAFDTHYDESLHASTRQSDYPTAEYSNVGFRVARVTPEPGGVGALVGMAAVGFLWFWRRR